MEQIKFDKSITESFSQQLIQLLSTLKENQKIRGYVSVIRNSWICISDHLLAGIVAICYNTLIVINYQKAKKMLNAFVII